MNLDSSRRFYRRLKDFWAAAFEQRHGPNHSSEQERIAYLEKKIQTKDRFWRSTTR